MTESAPPCPVCSQPAASPAAVCFPFCSLRCKAEDMYHWLDGSYERRLFGEEEAEEGVDEEDADEVAPGEDLDED